MTVSHAYSHRAPQPKSYLGVSVVVALHIAAIYAFSAGLIHPPTQRPENITLKPLPPEVKPEPPKLEPLRADQPAMPTVRVIEVPPPIFDIAQTPDAPSVTVVAAPKEAGPSVNHPAAIQTREDIAPASKTVVQTPGAVCSVMPRPEVPAVNWAGEAVLNVIATVRGGKVIGSEVRVTHGALDAKTRRSFQRSVEAALAGYQCQGDAMFQQDFAFRLD